jgi:hypothetical protein
MTAAGLEFVSCPLGHKVELPAQRYLIADRLMMRFDGKKIRADRMKRSDRPFHHSESRSPRHRTTSSFGDFPEDYLARLLNTFVEAVMRAAWDHAPALSAHAAM